MAGPSAPFFQALALSYALAVLASMFVAWTVTPALCLPAARQRAGRHRSVRARPCAGARALGLLARCVSNGRAALRRRRAPGGRHARAAAGAARRRAADVPRTQSRDPVGGQDRDVAAGDDAHLRACAAGAHVDHRRPGGQRAHRTRDLGRRTRGRSLCGAVGDHRPEGGLSGRRARRSSA
jgi:hypothetical protein